MSPSSGRARKWVRNSLLVLVGLLAVVLIYGPGKTESSLNRIEPTSDTRLSDSARDLHNQLKVADLHADTLLWDRNILKRSTRGHVDLPRLTKSNVAVQVFAAVTKSPRGQNYSANTADSDNITALAVLQRWPIDTWGSLLHRALYQAERLNIAANKAPGEVVLVTSQADLIRHLSSWQSGGPVGAVLALEGAHPLEANLANLNILYAAGYRMMGLQHFFDNALGGSLHGQSKAGLTEFGKQVVTSAVDMGFIIDVAHSSPAVVDDVLSLSRKPVVVSHTGIHGICQTPRNIADAQMQRIAAVGGLIGIGFWDAAVCDISPDGIARAIGYAIELLGPEAVALGSDYDGSTTVSFDGSQLALLTQALQRTDLSNEQIAGIMGENLIRFLTDQLPTN